jgi:hypothetical protein
MNLVATLALFLWLPMVVGIFVSMPPRRAVVFSFIFAWLALPTVGFGLPGLPDYTKMSATVAGVLGSAIVLDQARFLALRPRWFDVPMIVWCFSAFISAITNQLGAYEGVSSVLAEVVALSDRPRLFHGPGGSARAGAGDRDRRFDLLPALPGGDPIEPRLQEVGLRDFHL